MKPRESTIQAKEFQAAALRRQLAQFDRMIADLNVIATELGKQVEAEERRTGVTDPKNFAYSTIARAARDRRTNLTATLDEMDERRQKAAGQLAELESFFEALNNAGDVVSDHVVAERVQRSSAA